MIERRNVPEIVIGIRELLREIPNSDQSPLYDVRNPARASREGSNVRSDVSRTVYWATSLSINGQPVFALTSFAGHALPFGSSVAAPRVARRAKRGGARRDRTDDLMLAKHALSQLSYGPVPEDECFGMPSRSSRYQPVVALWAMPGTLRFVISRGCATRSHRRSVVGLGRLELPTSRLSSARSNQLSYKPLTTNFLRKDWSVLACTGFTPMHHTSAAPGACSSAKKEKRRRRNPANAAQQS
jgi:hypothetical protein